MANSQELTSNLPTNRKPSGNEFGANDQRIPGGKTDGGVSEAIVKTEGMQPYVDYIVTDL